MSQAGSGGAQRADELIARMKAARGYIYPEWEFFTKDLQYLHHYIEMPALYHKERLYTAMQVPLPGEDREQAWARFMGDWRALQASAWWRLWASATVDEILFALHERLVAGPRV